MALPDMLNIPAQPIQDPLQVRRIQIGALGIEPPFELGIDGGRR
jgi:hypothetical protein